MIMALLAIVLNIKNMVTEINCKNCDFSDPERMQDCKIRCVKYSRWVNPFSKCLDYSHTPSEYFLANGVLDEKKYKILS